MRVIILTLLLAHISLPALAQDAGAQDNGAQDNGAQNNNYVPPPLFAEPRDPPPKSTIKTPKLPAISKKIEDLRDDENSGELLIRPRVIPRDQQVNMDKETATPPTPAPIPPKKTATKPVATQPKSEGVVKGPKVMPAVKKKAVDQEITYENEKAESINILERTKIEAEKTQAKKGQSEKPLVGNTLPLSAAAIKSMDDPIVDFKTMRQLTLSYADEQANLNDTQKNKILQSVMPVLIEEKSARLAIEAFASPPSNILNSDRRLALSRAMAIRTFLLDNNIEQDRINVRSLGAQGNKIPLDRVEISLMD